MPASGRSWSAWSRSPTKRARPPPPRNRSRSPNPGTRTRTGAVVETTPEPEPIPEPEPEPIPEPEPEPRPAAAPEPEPAPEPNPPPVPLAKPAAQPEPFEKLLKDLAEKEPEPKQFAALEPAAPPEPPTEDESIDDIIDSLVGPQDAAAPDATAPTPLTGPLKQTISGTIKQKVEKNWSVPAGIRDAGTLVVTLRIQLGKDGSVLRVEIVDDGGGGGGNYRIMAESARRAVLKVERFEFLTRHGNSYDSWRNIEMRFSPPV